MMKANKERVKHDWVSDPFVAVKNIHNLKAGMEFDTYPKLCEFLEVPTTGGNTKLTYLGVWKNHFTWEKRKFKFIILKVHFQPELVINSLTTIGLTALAILNELAKAKRGTKYVGYTVDELLEVCNFVNPAFNQLEQRKQANLTDFFLQVRSLNRPFMIASLIYLEQEQGILTNWGYRIYMKGGGNRIATEDEGFEIAAVHKETANELGMPTIFIGKLKGDLKEYYSRINEKLQSKFGYMTCKEVIVIKFRREFFSLISSHLFDLLVDIVLIKSNINTRSANRVFKSLESAYKRYLMASAEEKIFIDFTEPCYKVRQLEESHLKKGNEDILKFIMEA